MLRVLVVVGLVLASACNIALDIEATDPLGPPPPDLDGDAIPDELDNCPQAENLDQVDGDGDGFGDACDRCPFATLTNHDEDGDLRGDDCDICPAAPDFQYDENGDGVGDSCTFYGDAPNRLVGFDPFVTLGERWGTTGVRWIAQGDAVGPVEVTTRSDPGLRSRDLLVGGNVWAMEIQAISKQRWAGTDRFGLGLVDGQGSVVARCELVCDGECFLEIESSGVQIARYRIPEAAPLVKLRLASSPSLQMTTNRQVHCGFTGFSTIGFYVLDVPTPVVSGVPVVFGSSTIQLAHFIAYDAPTP